MGMYKIKSVNTNIFWQLNIAYVCRQSLTTSSVHGYPYLLNGKGLIKKIIWFSLSLSATVMLLFNFSSILETYLQYNVSVVRTLVHSREVEFPAITVCNTNPIRKSKLYLSPSLQSVLQPSQAPVGKRRKKRQSPGSDTTLSIVQETTPEFNGAVTGGNFTSMTEIPTTSTKAPTITKNIYRKYRNYECEENTFIIANYITASDCDCSEICDQISFAICTAFTYKREWSDSTSYNCVLYTYCNETLLQRKKKISTFIAIEDSASEQTTEIFPFSTTGNTNDQFTSSLSGDYSTDEKTTAMANVMSSSTRTEVISVSQNTSASSTPAYDNTGENSTEVTSSSEEKINHSFKILKCDTNDTPAPVIYCEEWSTVTSEKTTVLTMTTGLVELNTTDNTTVGIDTNTMLPTIDVTTHHTTIQEATVEDSTAATVNITDSNSNTTTDSMIVQTTTECIKWTTESTTVAQSTTTPTTTSTTTTVQLPADLVEILKDRPPIRKDFEEESIALESVVNQPAALRQQMGYSLNDLVVQCTFKGRDCFSHDFTYFLDPNFGNCFVFNSGWNWESSDSHTHYNTYNSGPQQGLSLVANIQQSDYVDGISQTAGVIVVVHSHSRMPFPEDEGILAVPGHKTSIGMKKILQSRLGGLYQNCDENVESLDNVYKEYVPVNYSVNSCYKTCYQKYVIEKCGCADSQYPMYGEVFGSFSGLACSSGDIFQDACMYGILKQYAAGNISCNCPNPCTIEAFELAASEATWPPVKFYKETVVDKYPAIFANITDKEAYINDNFVNIEVYYEDLNIEQSHEVPSYRFDKFIADVAGILGLWLGCTLFTMLEAVEFVADLLVVTVAKLVKNKRIVKVTTTNRRLRNQRRYTNVIDLETMNEEFP